MIIVVHVVRGVVIAIVTHVGIVRVRRVVGVRVGRVGQRGVAVAVPARAPGARAAVLPVRWPAVLAVVAAVHRCLRLRSRQRARPCSPATTRTRTHRTHALLSYLTFRSKCITK